MSMITSFRQVVRYWWVFIALGSSLIIFGLLLMAFPAAHFATLGIFFQIAIVINGTLEIGFALTNYRSVHGWAWHLAGGIFDLLIGGLLLFDPVITAVSLPLFVGFWLLFRSIAIVGRCFDLPAVWPETAWMGLLGLAGLAFSFLILYNPALDVANLILLASLALISIGLFYVFLGSHFRQLVKKGAAK
ncbi:MAG TPA: DUF308 domain-containing protein [Puia sp.]|nr:DUF308 domain-containing protein [Puia sp.]